MLAFMDVCYHDSGARAAAVLAEHWLSATACAQQWVDIQQVAAYQPGAFYLRELPCLLALIHALPKMPNVLVIDGYVWLDGRQRPGLGAHLHQALAGKIPVVGIAKTAFEGADHCSLIKPVLRASSMRPLYVSCVDCDLQETAAWVQQMHGPHRIPALLKQADTLSRTPWPQAATDLQGSQYGTV